ncbi:MAG: tRNA 2-thiouridine(34) synthase MnmA [Vicinamibacterales bacterium]
MTAGRVVVAMSGGVDSSVAAALLKAQGHDVVGISMQLYDQSGAHGRVGSCCTLDDLHDARRVAATIGIPHYILNLEQRFEETVVRNFVGEYAAGRTPLPCAHCNSDLKFSTLVDRAAGFDAAVVATGHYARVGRRADGRWLLRRGADPDKDQSYFLFALTQAQLAQALFPVGDLSKADVRATAQALGLGVADKPDSQEICFVPSGDYAAFVETRAPEAATEGPIVDTAGRQLGTHGGIHRFTVGQRKGLGLSGPAPLYVLKLEPASGTVVVGDRTALDQTGLTASGVNWISMESPTGWTPVTAQIRHRHRAAPARVRAAGEGRAELAFDEPQAAITPGQAVVFYDGDVVVGGGWIDAATAASVSTAH